MWSSPGEVQGWRSNSPSGHLFWCCTTLLVHISFQMPNLNLPSCFCAHFPPLGCLPLREFGSIIFASSVQAAVGIGCCPSNLNPAGHQDEESLAALKRWSDTAGEGNIGTVLKYKVSHRLLWASFCPGTCSSNRAPCPFTTVLVRTSKMMKVDQMATTAILNNA